MRDKFSLKRLNRSASWRNNERIGDDVAKIEFVVGNLWDSIGVFSHRVAVIGLPCGEFCRGSVEPLRNNRITVAGLKRARQLHK